MENALRWGLLSTAKINQSLIEPLRGATRSELAAVASRDLSKATAYAAEWAIPTVYGSYEELLADPTIDVIYNSLPNSLHAEWTVKAAEAGKHVLCEKPLTLTLAELDQVEAAAKANGVTVFEAFMYLHHPQTRAVQRMIQAGEIGNLRQINAWFNFYLDPANEANIRLHPALGGGSLWDVGVYPNSLAIFMAGPNAPLEVWAQQVTAENEVEVVFTGQMRFENEAVAQISSSFRTPYRGEAFLVGDAGIIHIPDPWKPGVDGEPSHIILSGRDNQSEIIEFEGITPYVYEIEAMEACVLDGAEPVVPLSLSRKFLRTILACYESARTGVSVKLSA